MEKFTFEDDMLEKLEEMQESEMATTSFNSATSILQASLSIASTLKMFHWNTLSEPLHRALGDAYDDFSDKTDTLAEALIGHEGRCSCMPVFTNSGNMDEPYNMIFDFAKNVKAYCNLRNYPDLMNLSDEITGIASKLKYKYSFR